MTPPRKEIKRFRRFTGWDYSRGASLFITISTLPRRALFGQVVNGKMNLTPLGEEVLRSLEAMPRYNPGLSLFGHIVMPDHLHFNCCLEPGLAEPLKFLGNAVRRFKNHVSKERVRLGIAQPSGVGVGSIDSPSCARAMWQRGYHDRLLPSRQAIAATERYIAYNPAKWELMKNRPLVLRIKEPLDSPRLDPGDFWKGVGNTTLLDDANKIVALRISRKLNMEQLKTAERRIENAIAQGFTILSGFISPGEKMVRDLCCRRKDARFIRILPSCMSLAYKPESAYVEAFLENRYLEIAKGNDEIAFNRTACLDLNDEIVKIAQAGEGLAVYWR